MKYVYNNVNHPDAKASGFPAQVGLITALKISQQPLTNSINRLSPQFLRFFI
jgi:hypothetical protein